MIRRSVGQFLRRIAASIDPLPKADRVVPLEFLGTKELVDEIVRRNDSSVLFWGRECAAESGHFHISGSFRWRLKRHECVPVVGFIMHELNQQLDLKIGETEDE